MYPIPADDEQLHNLVHNIRTLRQRHGLSLQQMADILHTKPYTLRMLERGQISSRLYVDSLFYLREYFGLSFRDMFHTRI